VSALPAALAPPPLPGEKSGEGDGRRCIPLCARPPAARLSGARAARQDRAVKDGLLCRVHALGLQPGALPRTAAGRARATRVQRLPRITLPSLRAAEEGVTGWRAVPQYNFFDYANMRLHQVKVVQGQGPAQHLQFVAIAFTLGDQYEVNTSECPALLPKRLSRALTPARCTVSADSLVIPLTSVRVGRGTFASTANWQAPPRARGPAAPS